MPPPPRRKRIDPKTVIQNAPSWKWRTLPVWMALTGGFILGWYVAAFGAQFGVDQWAVIVLYVVLAGSSFGLSRIISRYTALRMMKRKLAKERGAAPEKRILSAPEARRGGGSSPRR